MHNTYSTCACAHDVCCSLHYSLCVCRYVCVCEGAVCSGVEWCVFMFFFVCNFTMHLSPYILCNRMRFFLLFRVYANHAQTHTIINCLVFHFHHRQPKPPKPIELTKWIYPFLYTVYEKSSNKYGDAFFLCTTKF